MKKTVNVLLIVGFVLADLIMFHDLFKAGEHYTMVEYLVGILSIFVFVNAARELLETRPSAQGL